MHRRAIALVLFAIAMLGMPRAAAAQAVVTIDEFAARLDDVARAIDALDESAPTAGRRLVGTIPASWTVTAGDRRWDVRAQWISRELTEWQRTPNRAKRLELAVAVRALRADALAYATDAPDSAEARAALARVLAAREFRGVHGQTWWNNLLQRTLRRLLSWFQALIGSSSLPTITNVVVYALIAVAVLALGMWTLHTLRRSETATMAPAPDEFAVLPRRSWNEWLAESKRFAEQQDWREAIRYAYWSGIVFLETKDLWTADGSRTPREYVRLVAADDAHAAPLRSLTQVLERVWYGASPADARRYEETLALLRTLGCPA